MTTLLTTGCSYTTHSSPTWDLWLTPYFDNYVPLGKSGSGMRYSYIKIKDYFKYNKEIDPKNHTVIVQWSSLIRHDIRDIDHHWKCAGQIDNNAYFNKSYINNYYSLVDSTNDFIHYVDSLTLLSKDLGFKLCMFYMFEPWLEDLLGEPCCHAPNIDKQIQQWKKSKYYTSLCETENSSYFLYPSIESHCLSNPKTKPIWGLNANGKAIIDEHPTPLQHFSYSKLISKKLNLPFPSSVLQKIVEDVNNIMETKELASKFIPNYKHKINDISKLKKLIYTI